MFCLEKRQRFKSLRELEKLCDQNKDILLYTLESDFSAIDQNDYQLLTTANQIKKRFSEYHDSCIEFVNCLTKHAALETAQENRNERFRLRKETHEALNIISSLREAIGVDPISNIDAESVRTQHSSVSNSPSAKSNSVTKTVSELALQKRCLDEKRELLERESEVQKIERQSSQAREELEIQKKVSAINLQESRLQFDMNLDQIVSDVQSIRDMHVMEPIGDFNIPQDPPEVRVASFICDASNVLQLTTHCVTLSASSPIFTPSPSFGATIISSHINQPSTHQTMPTVNPSLIPATYTPIPFPNFPFLSNVSQSTPLISTSSPNRNEFPAISIRSSPLVSATVSAPQMPTLRNFNIPQVSIAYAPAVSDVRYSTALNNLPHLVSTMEAPPLRMHMGGVTNAVNNPLFVPHLPHSSLPPQMFNFGTVGSTQSANASNMCPVNAPNSHIEVMLSHLMKQDLFKKANDPFDGDPFRYHPWFSLLSNRIANLNLSSLDIIDVLLANTSGKPFNMIKNYNAAAGYANPQVTLQNILSALHREFGSSLRVSSELINRLDGFPMVKTGQDDKMRELCIFCEILLSNMPYCPDLSVFNYAVGCSRIWCKLPEALQNKWRACGHNYEKTHPGTHPPLYVFVEFLKDQVDAMTNPNYMISPQFKAKSARIFQTSVETASDVASVKCLIHPSSSHWLDECKNFIRRNHQEKINFLNEHKLCYVCVGNHFRKDCKAEVKCDKCGYKHLTIMHNENIRSKPRPKFKGVPPLSKDSGGENHFKNVKRNDRFDNRAASAYCSEVCGSERESVSCSKTLLVELFMPDRSARTIKCYAIIDEQSNRSFADPKLLEQFNIQSRIEEYFLTTLSGYKSRVQGSVLNGLQIKGINESEVYILPPLLTCDSIPDTKSEVATPLMVKAHPHISSFAHRFPDIDHDAQVLLLLGRDCQDIMRTTCHGHMPPYVHHTALGWSVVGSVCQSFALKKDGATSRSTVMNTIITHDHFASTIPCFPTRSRYSVFDTCADDELPGLSFEDRKFVALMKDSITTNSKGNLVMPLPFRNPTVQLPDNCSAVYMRTKNSLTRLSRDSHRLEECLDVMERYQNKGHVEQVPKNETLDRAGLKWFIPIFPVTHPKKGKTRIVFDSTASFQGKSLNTELMQGPDENNRLKGVLLRFRLGPVGFIADIQMMFHSFYLPSEHKDFARFFWFKDNDTNQPLVQYRACVHVFGNKSSPAVATYGLRYAAEHADCVGETPARQFIENNFYVDDALGATESAEEAIRLLKDTSKILKQYNIVLHKINSNSNQVLEAFDDSEKSERSALIELQKSDSQLQKTLGIAWDTLSDEFVMTVNLPKKPFTKRGVVAVVNSIFDPLGLVSPITLGGKLIQRQILPSKKDSSGAILQYGWDDALPPQYLPPWTAWNSTLEEISRIKLGRSMVPKDFGTVNKRTIHMFSDASEHAIGYVCYSEFQNEEGTKKITFVCASSKVAPRGAVSIPRLELCAAVEAAKASVEINSELGLSPEDTYLYTDSMVVLGYLRNREKRFARYVSRRINTITALLPSTPWRYVSTNVNPADIATRPHSPQSLLDSCWLTGPSFLHTYEKYNMNEVESILDQLELPETVDNDVISLSSKVDKCSVFHSLFLKSNNWLFILSVARRVIMIAFYWRDMVSKNLGLSLASRSDPGFRYVLNVLIHDAQLHSYYSLFSPQGDLSLPKSHHLHNLSIFLSDEGVIRVGGRIKNAEVSYDEKHPYLIPQDHPLSTVIVFHYHSQTKHQGRHVTMGAIRNNGFYIEKGKKVIQRVIGQCVICRKLRSSLGTQKMANLPIDRLEESPPFTNTGLDVFGPYMVTDGKSTKRTNSSKKSWVLLFTCLVSRGIHLEPLPTMDTSSFVNALRRFFSIRGVCKCLRSDRGTNFVGALNQGATLTEIEKEVASHDCKWVMNPPHSSHMGGPWERKIGQVRRILDTTFLKFRNHALSRDEFSTLLAESAAIVNNTPLTAISASPDELIPISPAKLLTLKDQPNPQTLDELSLSDMLHYGKKRWKRIQFLSEIFWQRWRTEHLQTLQERSKWKLPKRSLSVGDIVLLRDKQVKRNEWPMARVITIKKSDDDLVRSVRIFVPGRNPGSASREYDRPIHELVLLIEIENQ